MANRRAKVKAVTDFIFLGSKITADHDYSHEIKRSLLLGRKARTNTKLINTKPQNIIEEDEGKSNLREEYACS